MRDGSGEAARATRARVPGWLARSARDGRLLAYPLVLLFLAAGLRKLAGAEVEIEGFRHYGYPVWFVYATGAMETGSALLLLAARTRTAGALLVACIMIGAFATHARVGDPAVELLPSVAVFVACGLLVYVRLRERREGAPRAHEGRPPPASSGGGA